ncbi:MAG: hypothetical protein R2724_23020 [Bryobacterales bacterium]
MQHRADQQSRDDVDRGDDDARHRVALGEAHRAVHCAVELSFARDFLAAALGFGLFNQSRVQVRIDRHLLARQGVQSEARGDFGDTHRAVVDHHVLNGEQQDEDDDSDGELAADDEVAECFDDAARGIGPEVAVHQYQPRAGDVERQPQQREQQQQGRVDAQFHRARNIHRGDQRNDR